MKSPTIVCVLLAAMLFAGCGEKSKEKSSREEAYARGPKPAPDFPATDNSKPDEQKSEPNNWVGKWRLYDDKGNLTCHMTLNADRTAIKSHAPSVTARYEILNGVVYIEWSDKWRNTFKPVADKVVVESFDPERTWTDTPTNVMSAVRDKPKADDGKAKPANTGGSMGESGGSFKKRPDRPVVK